VELILNFAHLKGVPGMLERTRNSSGDEIANANVNFLRPGIHVVHEFGEITQNKGHYSVQGHSRLSILVPIESSYTTSYY